ncbi:MAG: GntR family transcriptional regulator [Flavobacterium sp.]|jgi:predicted RNA-binding protein (virulence factor B family)|nr:GntR family transcriptional regulator [Flavobacterium sp.]HQV35886.1 S1-like domain-containing RNA-binding protein [Flavobacterium sp.]HQX03103.1 S1-like domain-containing RNA-binding protein [Flavobacterium sp.]
MLTLGIYHTLRIDRTTLVGLFLTDEKDDVLLPIKYVPKKFEMNDMLEVFVYLDHEERPVATTLKPYITLGDYAFLRVNYTNEYGAFLDWGLEKDLFVPFQEQARPMEQGKRYMVHMYLDEKTNRLVGSSKINQFLSKEPLSLESGTEVDLIISHITDLGINVIVNGTHKGLVYKNEVYTDSIRPGDKTKGYIKIIRPDGKIDVTFNRIGVEAIEENAQVILDELKASRGFLRLNDNSSPDDIKTILKMSKKTFKKAVGTLYKQKLIEIKDDGIHLLS